MYYYEVAPTQIVRSDSSVFTYSYPETLQPGHIVTIEVGKKHLIGVVMRSVEQPAYNTKPISSIIETTPLPAAIMNLAQWMSEYYVTHKALVLQTILPKGITKSRRERQRTNVVRVRGRTQIVLNRVQSDAIREMDKVPKGTVLLHGITGSGKTIVYIEAAKRVLSSKKSVIVLVPEIALTSQLVDEFSNHFDTVLLTHSRQTEAERHTLWQKALTTGEPCIVIGPRSALFMPLKNVGLIVIDECHEPSYKQEQSPRYSALRAASILAKNHNAKVVLGSATPSISDYYIAKTTNRPIIELAETARPSTPPSVTLVDMTKREYFRKHRFLSDVLITQLEQTFNAGNQALIFHNRRGSANTTLCENCGWNAVCSRCFVPLTLHADRHLLRCHICGITEKVPTNCPICNGADIIHKGIGTKLIEVELSKLFPRLSIARFDGDSESDQSLDSRYKEVYDGSINLIIGTQVVAKGLDLPHLRTVGIVQADAGLSLPDFASSERTFQLLAQAVGRVGRSDHSTSVVVQSYHPGNTAVVNGLTQNYKAFYDEVIGERKRAQFPPFVFLLKLTCVYKTESAAIRNSQMVARSLRQKLSSEVEVLGPTPSFYERQRDTYRWQLILKSKNRDLLVNAIQHLPSTHWQFELDPFSLI